MTWLVLYVTSSVVSLFILWVMFVVVMTMRQLRDVGRLSPFMVNVGISISVIGLVWDVLCNILIVSILFLEFPWEATVSARLRRLVGDKSWRGLLARWFATVTMNPFCPPNDPHIRIPE